MAERVQVVLEAQDLASGVLRGLVSKLGTLGQVISDVSDAGGRFNNFLKVMNDTSASADEVATSYQELGVSMARLGETVAIMVVETITEAIKVTDEYNSQIRDLSLVSGEGAESTSRFIQVLDDYELTAEDAMTAAKALKEKGLSPTIDTLAILADEFKKIKDPAERMAFVQENLGKGGAKWVNVLNQESAALRQAAASIDPWLVKTDEQIKKAEISRLALDNLGDSWAAFQNRIGDAKNELVFANEASTRAYEILKEQGIQINAATNRTQEYRDAVEQANAELLASAEASLADTAAKEADAEALKALAEANAEIISNAIAITDENENYKKSQDDIIKKVQELTAEKDKLISQGWWAESEAVKDVQAKIDDLNLKYEENAEAYIAAQEKKFAMEAVNKIEMEDGVAGFNEAERSKAQAILETTDVATAAAFEQAQAQSILTDAVANGRISVEEFGSILDSVMADGVVSVDEVTAAINAIPEGKSVTIDIITNGMIPTNLDPTASNAPVGTHRRSNASGGTYMIPIGWGNEGLPIGSSDTASGGELISITPRGQDPNKAVVDAIMSTRIDYNELARAVVVAAQERSK